MYQRTLAYRKLSALVSRCGFWTGFDASKKQRICKEQNFAQQDSVECAEDSTTTLCKKERKVLNTKVAEET